MISVDDPQTNKEFAASLDADFPLLSDPTKGTATAYGVLRDYGERIGTVAQRWTFYIGGDGHILRVDKDVSASTAGEDIVEILAELNVPKRQ